MNFDSTNACIQAKRQKTILQTESDSARQLLIYEFCPPTSATAERSKQLKHFSMWFSGQDSLSARSRGLNYESVLKRLAGLNLKAIDNGPKMVTMDRATPKSGPNLGPKQPIFRLAISLD